MANINTFIKRGAPPQFHHEIKTIIEGYFFLKSAMGNIAKNDNYTKEAARFLSEWAAEVIYDLNPL